MFRAQSTKDKVVLYNTNNKKEKLLISVSISGNNHEIPHRLIDEVSQFIRYLKLDGYTNALQEEPEEVSPNNEPKKRGRKKKIN